ncbi:phage major capsid protein [Microbacterium esteraromaticum]|uniref:phage major capsid protein n=1 Tax=Microbacterium esteraromaticum TaxID=57043 RepID=UPI0019D3FEED|nr:hypothetical protein [Microbacterium esteraromaticum]MBN7792424.1 hypothetical protein [Microbacterium esteraromaticum]
MASYTYPVKHPEGTLTTEQVHALLSSSRVVAKRVASLVDQKFIADFLLSGRFSAQGGGVFYETGEEIFAADSPEAVAPGAEYPKTVLTQGEIAAAKTVKWGIESDITDEKIAREGITVVNRALGRLGNTVVKHVDGVAMAVITAKVTDTAAAAGAWTTPGVMLETIEAQAAARAELGTGIDLDTVLLKPAKYAKLLGIFIDKGALPREAGNAAITGNLPVELFGWTFVTSPHYASDNPMLLDREQLGGMADEDLGSPGYVRTGTFGVETKSDRHRDDKYEVRARRVTVPVVTEPKAGITITGTAL